MSVSLSSFSCQYLPVLFAYNDYASVVTYLCVSVRPSLITSLPLCLCYYLSECLYVSVSLHPFVRQPGFPSIHWSIRIPLCLTVSLSVFLFVCLFFRPCIQLLVCTSICPSIYLSVHTTYICLSAFPCMSFCASLSLSVHFPVSIRLLIHLSVSLSVYPTKDSINATNIQYKNLTKFYIQNMRDNERDKKR